MGETSMSSYMIKLLKEKCIKKSPMDASNCQRKIENACMYPLEGQNSSYDLVG